MYQKFLDVDVQGEGSFIRINDSCGGSFYEWILFCGHVSRGECDWIAASEYLHTRFEDVPEEHLETRYGHLDGWVEMIAKYMEQEAYGEPKHIYGWGDERKACGAWDWRFEYDVKQREEKGSVPITMFDLK